MLTVFVMGVAVGVMGMVPRWWKHRRLAQMANTPTTEITAPATPSADTTHGI